MKQYTSFFLLLLLSSSLFAQLNPYGNPIITNYKSTDFKASPRNYSIAKNSEGIFYFGNEGCILEFDGTKWNIIKIDSDEPVRALLVDSIGNVYSNTGNEFGFLAPNDKGVLTYNSLCKNLPELKNQNSQSGNIFILNNHIYFQTLKKIFRYDIPAKEKPNKEYEAITSFQRSFLVNDKDIYVQQVDTGLFILENEKFTPLANGTRFVQRETVSMLPYARKQVFLGTRKSGLFYYTPKRGFGKYLSESSEDLDRISLLQTIAMPEKYIMATINKGILVINREKYGKKSHIIEQINKSTGMPTEFVTSLYHNKDNENQQIWATTQYGISSFELNPQLRKIFQTSEIKDVIIDLFVYGDTIFAQTIGELHKLAQNEETNAYEFSRIGGVNSDVSILTFPTKTTTTKTNVSYIQIDTRKGLKKIFKSKKKGRKTKRVVEKVTTTKIDSLMLIGNQQGLFYLNNNSVSKVATNYRLDWKDEIEFMKKGKVVDLKILSMHHSQKDTLRLLIGHEEGLSLFSFQHNYWVEEGSFDEINQGITDIEEDKDGNYWLATSNGELLKMRALSDSVSMFSYVPKKKDTLRFSFEFKEKYQISSFNVLNELPTMLPERISIFENKLLVHTRKGLYSFDESVRRFTPEIMFGNEYCNGNVKVMEVVKDKFDNVWIRCENAWSGWIEKLKTGKNGIDLVSRTKLDVLPEMNLQKIFVDDEYLWISGTEGLFTYKLDQNAKDETTKNTLIRQVFIANDSLVFNGIVPEYGKNGKLRYSNHQLKDTLLVLDYAFNNIRFSFASPSLIGQGKKCFRYRLVGLNDEWTDWSDKTEKEYNNLAPGNYVFEVESKSNSGKFANKANYRFRIPVPWFKTREFYITSGVVALLLIVLIFLAYSRRLRQRNRELDRLVKKRTKELEERKEELEKQHVQLETQNREISEKNDRLELQQKEIITINTELEKKHQEIKDQNSQLKDQKEEILVQSDKLKVQANALTVSNNQIKQAYENIKLLSEFGQKITATLNPDTIHEMVYDYVRSLMQADVFGIGIYNKVTNTIDFDKLVADDKFVKPFYHDLQETNSIAVWSFRNQKEAFINQLSTEYKNYVSDLKDTSAQEGIESLLMLPLVIEGKTIGVITAQNKQTNAYNNHDLSNLQTLASYLSIALDNANAYRIVHNQNEHITGSIRYAQSIQASILPSVEEIQSKLDSFILYKPKDVVSGDFYWFSVIPANDLHPEKVFIAAIDCTGHGVPGAFMSVLGISLLNDIVNQKQIHETNWILELLNQGIQKSLKQQQTRNTDGMDVCLCCIENTDKETTVHFTGAKRNLLYYSANENEIKTIKSDRKPIGGIWSKAAKLKFTSQELHPQKGDIIYLTSDGYTDQHSPLDRRRFGTANFIEVLQNNASKNMEEQKATLNDALKQHQRHEEQRDDITVIGVRF